MDLVFIRHGKTEENSRSGRDADRELTENGRSSMIRILPAFKEMLGSSQSIRIWSSPFLRALQTAELLGESLQVDLIEKKDFIAQGSLELLIRAVRNAGAETHSDDACILIVGHEPHLSSWSRQLCGQRLPFKKGAAACIRVQNSDFRRAALIWFMQPTALEQLQACNENL